MQNLKTFCFFLAALCVVLCALRAFHKAFCSNCAGGFRKKEPDSHFVGTIVAWCHRWVSLNPNKKKQPKRINRIFNSACRIKQWRLTCYFGNTWDKLQFRFKRVRIKRNLPALGISLRTLTLRIFTVYKLLHSASKSWDLICSHLSHRTSA